MAKFGNCNTNLLQTDSKSRYLYRMSTDLDWTTHGDFIMFGLPEHTYGSLMRYYFQGLEPGGFATAFLANDLHGATSRADHINITHFKEIARFVTEHFDPESYGSYEKVANWRPGNAKYDAVQLSYTAHMLKT